MSASKPITRQAVLAYAAELRAEAEKVTNPDPGNQDHAPFYKPYAPSDDAAQKLVTRKQAELVDGLGPNTTDEEIATARELGPAAALREMKWIVKQRVKSFQSELEAERRRVNRHVNQIRPIQSATERARQAMTPGQRIDDALGKLSIIAAGTTASLAERVTTGNSDDAGQGGPPFVGDQGAKARQLALDAAEAVEEELDNARSRRIEKIAA